MQEFQFVSFFLGHKKGEEARRLLRSCDLLDIAIADPANRNTWSGDLHHGVYVRLPVEDQRVNTLLDRLRQRGVAPFTRIDRVYYPPELFQHAADFDLMDDPVRVVAMNREVRNGPLYGVTWPAHYFAIGENGCGDYYCLDLSRGSSPVIFFDHETRSFVERAQSLQEWWPAVVREYEQT